LPFTGVGVTELFNLIVGTAMTPSQSLGANIFVPSDIATFTGVGEILVVTSSVIAGTVAIVLSQEVLTGTRMVALVTVSGIVMSVGFVLTTT
jgi:hypothetical protein